MKKILCLMFLCVMLVVGLRFGSRVSAMQSFGPDSTYKSVVNNFANGSISSGDVYICDGLSRYSTSVSVYSSDYRALANFIDNYRLSVTQCYTVNGVCVTMFYSPLFGTVYDGSNFQVADYGDKYIVGCPYIYEGF